MFEELPVSRGNYEFSHGELAFVPIVQPVSLYF